MRSLVILTRVSFDRKKESFVYQTVSENEIICFRTVKKNAAEEKISNRSQKLPFLRDTFFIDARQQGSKILGVSEELLSF